MLPRRQGLSRVMAAPRMPKRVAGRGGCLMRSGVTVGSRHGVARSQLWVGMWGKRGRLSLGVHSGVLGISM